MRVELLQTFALRAVLQNGSEVPRLLEEKMKVFIVLMGLCLAVPSPAQASKPNAAEEMISPNTAGELKQLCKSYQLVSLEAELKKPMGSNEVIHAAACLNFISGVM